ncbi:hypothetical protein GCM10027443_22900 [Pontibacter brevis]
MTNLQSFEKLFEAAVEQVAQRTAQLILNGLPPQPHSPQPSQEAEDPIDTEEMRRVLQVSRKTLSDWRASGKIPSFKVGKRVYFFKSKVLEAVQSGRRSNGDRRHTRGRTLSGRRAA